MLFCPSCKKEVIVYGVSPGAVPADALSKMAQDMEAQVKMPSNGSAVSASQDTCNLSFDETFRTSHPPLTRLNLTCLQGKLVLFNPPPFGKQHCPRCTAELEEK